MRVWIGALALCACGGSELELDGDLASSSRAILDGRPSQPTEHSAVGAIFARPRVDGKDGDYYFYCTGSLIAPDVVLTAAHCLERKDVFCRSNDDCTITWSFDHRFTTAADIRELHGEVERVRETTIGSLKSLQYPRFQQSFERVEDIGLMFLATAIEDLEPLPLATTEEMAGLVRGSTVTIVGYGLSSTITFDFGVRYESQSLIKGVTHGELRVGGESPVARKCYGDSGGPTLLDVGGVEKIIGITSRGRDGLCEIDGIDTRVDVYQSWIAKELDRACRDGHRATCAAEKTEAPPASCTATAVSSAQRGSIALIALMAIALLFRRST